MARLLPRRPGGRVAAALGLVVAGVGVAVGAWIAALASGVRNPPQEPLPERADAVIVFAGEGSRFVAARQLTAEGLAGVLVLSAPDLPEVAQGWCDEVDPGPFEIRCVLPDPGNTRGEGRMFAELADAEGWGQLVAVTSASHAQRALTNLEKCYAGEVAMAPVTSRPVGVRQVVAEALAIAATILVLDEATAALDVETEAAVVEAVRGLAGELSLVVVAHRLSTIRDCDQVAYLDKGRIRAVGTFTEVAEQVPEFARAVELAGMQAGDSPG